LAPNAEAIRATSVKWRSWSAADMVGSALRIRCDRMAGEGHVAKRGASGWVSSFMSAFKIRLLYFDFI
jgi:hypothetical protein